MQLSSTARKALAAGLAVSTVVWSMAMFVMPVAFAAPHGNGCLINQSGTIYLVENGVKRGFPSADVYASHGQNFGQVVTANNDDLTLPTGPVMVYRDGTLVKGPSDPLVYLVANGQKRGFVSGAVYTGLGYSWANVRTAAVNTFADLPTGANLESATERHTNGIMVKDSTGTIWIMTATGKKGMPSMEVFNSYGYRMSEVVPANAADVAANNEGVLTARVVCADSGTPVVNGAVNVSLAGSTPVSSTIVAGSSATELAQFTFTGNGTVTGLNLKRIGVSGDDTLTNVYLFDGATRITDASSVSANSAINFSNGSGLFTVNGSKTISVKADIKAATAGQTVGAQVASATLSSGTVGGLPVSGNIMSIASATLAGVQFQNGSVLPTATTVDPSNDIVVWQRQVTVSQRDVNMTRLALRQISSINSSDVKNFRLLVDGTTISTVANLDANNYVTFAFNKTLTTGTHTIKAVADIIGGSSRKLQMSLRGAYDVNFTDTAYNVGVTATLSAGSFPANGGEQTIGDATLTVNKTSDSPSGNVTNNANDVVLGKWTMTAYGEPVKVEKLTFGYAHGVGTSTSLRNGRVMLNGSQYGNTTNLAAAGTDYTVNYTVQPGTPVTVELRADMYAAAGGALAANNTITASLNQGSGNGQGTVSLKSVDVPTAAKDANQIKVTEGNTIGLAKQSNYGDQTSVVPQTAYAIAKYNLTGSSTEDINVDTITVKLTGAGAGASFTYADLTNLYVKYGTSNETTKAQAAATNTWSVNHVLAKNAVVPVEIYADIGSTITADDTMMAELTVSGTTASSGVAATTATEVHGQVIKAATGDITAALDASSPVTKLADDNATMTAAAIKFTAKNDNYTITDMTLTLADTTAVQNIIIKDGSTVVATRPAEASVTFSGLSIPVNNNSPKVLTVDLQLGTVGVGAGLSGKDVKVTLDTFTANNSNGVPHTDGTDAAGNSIYVLKAVPTITPVTLPTSLLATGTQTIAKFTVNSNGSGTVSWKSFVLSVSKSANPTIADGAASTSVWDADTNTQVAGTSTAAGLSGAGVASGTVTFVATNEQEISGAKTYIVKATIGGSVASTDSINTNIGSSSTDITDGAALGTANAAAALRTSGANFVWSDESAESHAATTFDWYSDYLVKNLPTDTQNMKP